MPVVRIDWFTGRSKAQKEELARRIEEAMVEVGCCKPGSTYVIFNDVHPGDWAIGGKLKE
ncbi:MAG TPA: 4-oxalocrotonate tautomerase family protein [Firmicutes bacterium]|jgi:4-oxalocrotonate tautomerase|nr:4-oxalocrotonate tautomerase family protein [Bacillota bacterium]HOQ23489.1 4-oxalocrotonate tautomerase family protein [Bacillota bacterium]HPT67984.1 4-oxalocrotonate tautomerase family protein [Bacillota bacterium]